MSTCPAPRRVFCRLLYSLAGLLLLAGQVHAQPVSPALTIGVLPNVSARVLISAYQPMREYFERELQRSAEIVTAPDFRAFSERALRGDYQLMVTAPNLGRVAQLDAQWELLAVYEPRIPALVVASADNLDSSATQLRGKALAMANPQSLVALVALDWLQQQGLRAGSDFRTVLSPNDDSLGAVLKSGEAPWAIMSMGEFRAKPEALRNGLRIVTEIARVPGFFVMANPSLPVAQRQRLKSLILGFPATEDGKKFLALSGFSAIREATEADLKFLDPFIDATRKGLGSRP